MANQLTATAFGALLAGRGPCQRSTYELALISVTDWRLREGALMSIQAVQAALDFAGLPPGEKIVLVGLANHEGPGGCWVGIATLARYAGVQPRQVQRLIGRLVDRGVITVDRNRGGTANTRADRRPNRYQLHIDGVSPTSPREIPNGVTLTTPRSDVDGTSSTTCREGHGVSSEASTGWPTGPNGVASTPPEPSINHLEEPSPQIGDILQQRVDQVIEAAGPLFVEAAERAGDTIRHPLAFRKHKIHETKTDRPTRRRIEHLVAQFDWCNNNKHPIDERVLHEVITGIRSTFPLGTPHKPTPTAAAAVA